MASLLHDDDGARDVLLLHALAVGLDRLDTDLEVLGEEDEHLGQNSIALLSTMLTTLMSFLVDVYCGIP